MALSKIIRTTIKIAQIGAGIGIAVFVIGMGVDLVGEALSKRAVKSHKSGRSATPALADVKPSVPPTPAVITPTEPAAPKPTAAKPTAPKASRKRKPRNKNEL